MGPSGPCTGSPPRCATSSHFQGSRRYSCRSSDQFRLPDLGCPSGCKLLFFTWRWRSPRHRFDMVERHCIIPVRAYPFSSPRYVCVRSQERPTLRRRQLCRVVMIRWQHWRHGWLQWRHAWSSPTKRWMRPRRRPTRRRLQWRQRRIKQQRKWPPQRKPLRLQLWLHRPRQRRLLSRQRSTLRWRNWRPRCFEAPMRLVLKEKPTTWPVLPPPALRQQTNRCLLQLQALE